MKRLFTITLLIAIAITFITTIVFIVEAINTYNYEVTNDDIMAGFGAVMIAIVGSFVIFYELDLFYTVYYFLTKPKTLAKSILNILANASLLLIFFADYYKDVFSEDVIAIFLVFAIYIVLRISCFVVQNKKISFS